MIPADLTCPYCRRRGGNRASYAVHFSKCPERKAFLKKLEPKKEILDNKEGVCHCSAEI